MGKITSISWCDHTFNPWRGCAKVSEGCRHCYAETLSKRNPGVLGEWGPNGTRVIASEAMWREPLKWDREAREAGVRRRVFCASLADFAEERAELVTPRMRLFQLIGRTPHLDWLMLTKRPQTVLEHWSLWTGYWLSVQDDPAVWNRVAETRVLLNVWLGVSVEDQQRADERIPILLQTPAVVRFLSVEPLLEEVSLSYKPGTRAHLPGCLLDDIHWVIVGGESGPGSRPCHLEWIRSIVRQCQEASVPVFVKQLGAMPTSEDDSDALHSKHGTGYALGHLLLKDLKGGDIEEWPEDLRVRQFPEATTDGHP